MLFKNPIAISLSPNTQFQDVVRALAIIVKPWKWKQGYSIERVEEWFKDYYQNIEAISFNSGRSALFAIFKVFGIGDGDEVLLQAFTCVAVPNAVIWSGACPVYVDIDKTLNIDPKLIEKKISKKTKAIIVQHTFGIPANIKKIIKIAKKYNLLLIEDCAHSLGAKINNKKIGLYGDVAILSFGRDKVISSVFGGMVIINSKHKIKCSKLRQFQKSLSFPSYFWIFQQLLHPILFSIILPLYSLQLGKLILVFFQKINLLSKAVFNEEKRGLKPRFFPERYPAALAFLLTSQLSKLDIYNKLRIRNTNYYFENLKDNKAVELPERFNGAIYLRFNIMTSESNKIISNAKKKGIILGDWYKNTIDPRGVLLKNVNYSRNSCPWAETAANNSVNLPTYPRLNVSDLKKIIDIVKISI